MLELLVDSPHPATNFLGGTVDYPHERVRDFTPVRVPVDTVDAIFERALGGMRRSAGSKCHHQ